MSLALETKLPVVRKTSGSQGIDLRDQRKMSAIEVCLKKVWVVWDKTDLSFSQLDFPAFKMVSYSKFKECHLALSSSKKRSRAAFLDKLEIDDLSRYNGLLFHHMHMKQQCCWLISKDVPTLIGHFHDDDFWLQLPEFICFCSRIQIWGVTPAEAKKHNRPNLHKKTKSWRILVVVIKVRHRAIAIFTAY